MASSEVQLHVDDVCTSKSSNETAVGYVERTHAEVESHAANPASTYGGIHRHRSVSRQLYKTFLQDGIPPKGYVLMHWQTETKVELVPCSDLVLLDRTFMSGDLIRSVENSKKSGTVINARSFCTLLSTCDVKEVKTGKIMKAAWLPSAPDSEEQPAFELVSDGKMLLNIPSSELKSVQTFNEADIIIYKNWVGRIKDCFDEVTVRLPDNGVVTITDDRNIEAINGDPDERFTVGSLIKTKKGILRTGRWIYGSYSPNTPPVGVVVDVRTKECQVDWLHHNMSGDMSSWGRTPESFLGLDELESDDLFVYDTSRMPQGPHDNSSTKSRSDSEFQGGIRVRFKDIAGASVKYNGQSSPNKIDRLDRRDYLGYDMNVFTITSTTTEVDIQWSDKTMETLLATKIVRDPLADDEDVVFMGEIVCTNEIRSAPEAAADWTTTPARVGIAEEVNHKDRIARVRWFKDGNLSFIDKDLIHVVANTHFSGLGTEVEEMSFYDIRAPKSINRDRGDFVILKMRPGSTSQNSTTHGVQWFGEVVDIGFNGTCTVRFGASKSVTELECNITDTIPAMNQELETGEFDSTEEAEADLMDYIEGSDVDDYSDDSDFDMDAFEEWYEEGQEMPIDEDDESWSTESEGDDHLDHDHQNPAAEAPQQGGPDFADTTARKPAIEGSDALANNNHTGGSSLENGSMTETSTTATPKVPTEDLHLTSLPNAPPSYEILDSEVPAGHHFWLQTGSISANHMKSVQREHKILSAPGALPEGVYVRTWESRMDLIRVLFVGPTGTPYEYAPFVIDLHLPPAYPYEPPKAFFHSWTAEGAGMTGRVNPNLYEEGKICLSLLGTWQGDESKNEAWAPNKSTVLQVLVSILGLVLVKEPYYNEAGYDSLQGLSSINQNASAYTERTYLRARAFILSPVSRLTRNETAGLEGLEGLIRWLYMDREGAGLMTKAIKACRTILANSEGDEKDVTPRDGLSVVTRGAALPLKRVAGRLEQLLESQVVSDAAQT